MKLFPTLTLQEHLWSLGGPGFSRPALSLSLLHGLLKTSLENGLEPCMCADESLMEMSDSYLVLHTGELGAGCRARFREGLPFKLEHYLQ